MGQHAQDTAELFFTDVRVPKENLLGEEGQGFVYLMQNLPQERLSIAVGAVASAETVLAHTREYVTGRKAFGKPVASFQNTRFVMAEMQTETTIARTFVDECIRLQVPALWLQEGVVDETAALKARAAGIFTVASPCILPVLPILFGSDQVTTGERDAHYNAARLHEQAGNAQKAVRHFSAYRRLQQR